VTPPRPLYLDDVPAGPPAGTLIVRVSELPAHGGKDVMFSEGSARLQLIVQRLEDGVRVFENRCPHAGTPLNMFDDRFLDISGKRLICRTHGALFDPDSGKCVRGPCKGQYLRPVAVEVRDGGVYSL
jgi:nitrite reductase/ring-hydroxylating ferredoxin subunit